MEYTAHWESPLGWITLASDGASLTGLWFDGQKYYAGQLEEEHEERDLPVFAQTKQWLRQYFHGMEPGEMPPLALRGTPFRLAVWEILREIPYGETTTYGAIAAKLAEARGMKSVSAQAVGGAVGHNPISVLVPCHRVIGADGSLTGYAGGLDRKKYLLELEGVNTSDGMTGV